MQITCFGVHSEFIRDRVKLGDWVQLRNLQVKYGRNANNLEGYLREDRGSFNTGVRIDVVSTDDPENVDSRLKDAIRRKREYEKAKKKQMKKFAADQRDKANGGKRKGEGQEEEKRDSKTRRTELRAQRLKKIEEQDLEQEAKLGLNESSMTIALFPGDRHSY
ncbi:hypothetical protein PC116_g27881 [Phytophthora cactorum]|nr:hypothetical protein PC116_g27881 [Phytophthora cactorum]